MRCFLLMTILWATSYAASIAQPQYINSQQTLGYLATVFTGVYPTDSCLYAMGVMTDSLLRDGSFFTKMDLSGNII
ncbi:MAG TPA: hypothetical protein PK971_06090 [Saprospiraceae bacterium]|nr:hypothetical protein [Saprospiraceae bacterium]